MFINWPWEDIYNSLLVYLSYIWIVTIFFAGNLKDFIILLRFVEMRLPLQISVTFLCKAILQIQVDSRTPLKYISYNYLFTWLLVTIRWSLYLYREPDLRMPAEWMWGKKKRRIRMLSWINYKYIYTSKWYFLM